MPLDPEDEARLVVLETFRSAMVDYINSKLDFDARSYVNQKIIEYTPPEEE